MLHGYGQHQCTTAAVLGHFAGGIGITLHKGHQAGRGQGRILYGRSFGPDVGKVMTYTSASLHQLHLLLVDLHDTAIRIRGPGIADHETVGQRGNLVRITDTGHRASLRNNVFEVFDEFIDLLFRHRVFIKRFYTCDFTCDTAVHIIG